METGLSRGSTGVLAQERKRSLGYKGTWEVMARILHLPLEVKGKTKRNG